MGIRGPLGLESKMRKPGQLTGSSEPLPETSLTGPARDEWDRVIGLLRDRGVLDALDQAALRDYVVCWDRLRLCEEEIAEKGILVAGERGMVKNPICQLARSYRDSMLAWSKEFGLTYSSRARLALPEKPGRINKFELIGLTDEERDRVVAQQGGWEQF